MKWVMKNKSDRIWNLKDHNGQVLAQVFRWEKGGPYMISNQGPLSFLFKCNVNYETLEDCQTSVEKTVKDWTRNLEEQNG